MKDVYVVYIGDGYLYGGSTHENANSRHYWMLNESYSLILLHNVPDDIVDKLERQGTSDQWYDDGYEAAQAVSSFESTLIWEEVEDVDAENDDDEEED